MGGNTLTLSEVATVNDRLRERREAPQVVRILLVDDDRSARATRIAIQRWFSNVMVDLVHTAEEAWQLMVDPGARFDAFILDNDLGTGKRLDGDLVTGPELYLRFCDYIYEPTNKYPDPHAVPCMIHTAEAKEDLHPEAGRLLSVGRIAYLRKGDLKSVDMMIHWLRGQTPAQLREGRRAPTYPAEVMLQVGEA